MVIADNEVKLKDIQSRVVENNLVFGNIAAISISSISLTLAKHRVQMKQLYKVPFERNSERIKELRRQYVQVRLCNTVITVHYIECFAVNFSINLEYSRTYSKAFTHTVSDYFQRVMELEANQVPHEMIYVDEAGFNLAKRRRRGRNIIGKRATVTVPGQRGANITMCAAISINGALLNKCVIGPYNTDRLLLFLEDLHERLVPEVERGQLGDLSIYVITWNNVASHHSRAVTAWFDAHPRMMSLFVAPYSPFLNPIEEFFSAWRWKVFDHRPQDQMSLLDAMDAACQDITAEHCQGWIRHTKRFFPRCLAREDIRCDVDENM